MEGPFKVVFFSTLAALAIGSWLFFRRLDLDQRALWQPRVTLINSVVLGLFFIVPLIPWRNWLGLAVTLGFFAFLVYAAVYKTRTCTRCGKVTQPPNLVTAAEFCPKCGAKLAPTRLFS